MSSVIEICNLALNHIGAASISSLSESSVEAEKCNAIYEQCRDMVLSAHDWNFAHKEEELALLTTTFTGWTYAYGYPSGCLVFRSIMDTSLIGSGSYLEWQRDTIQQAGKVQYKIVNNDTLNEKAILTEMVNAEGVWTARVEDTTMFSMPFVEALSFKMADYLAYPIKGDLQLKEAMTKLYLLTLSQAKAFNSNEDEMMPQEINVLDVARG